MDRRELLKMIGMATGAAFVGNAMAWTTVAEATSPKAAGFSDEDLMLLNEVAETIIPRTDTPGAKDANVAHIMAVLVADCYLPEEQQVFRQGMADIDKRSQSDFGKPFLLLNKNQRQELLSALNQEAYRYNGEHRVSFWELSKPGSMPGKEVSLPHYFTLFKQLTLFGFFTSEVGATKVLRYEAIPGRYDGEYPYKKGDRAWAT
ncbi:gluconate 2-dehydrogenase subunit 3 family protein [Lacimicrobium alkaliphilum]|uniref:Twin-arginine translocation pathway signal n=1 Tax=Lacimicrobium alkaliphilum TaxID=1526571 RepID=A0A0U2PCT1_9ALTE|nr:gluconate 2-dehydrogenase subunit 3 family protein [Lacimicrobium alkaliphilum]ALS96845.1 Twin-arginine translocation pathway signal [Lacimicrobium alkaliphilum]